jgi:uncharacterized YigZ family protein
MNDPGPYLTVNAASIGEFRERGSKFIAHLLPVSGDSDVRDCLEKVKKDHPKADHYCYGYCFGPSRLKGYWSDDREPSGSAGKPIYGAILSSGLNDVIIVVVRYFGGTKLGVAGLINAYRNAAQIAIAKSEKVHKVNYAEFHIKCDFEFQHLIYSISGKYGGIIKRNADILLVKIPEEVCVDFSSEVKNTYPLNQHCTFLGS